MRVCAYYRVSSSQQRDAGTIDGQRAEVRQLVASRGWHLVAEHADDGRSARSKLAARTGFAAVLALATSGAIDAVVCVAFDRLTRAEDVGEQGAILGTLQAAGVRLVTGGGEETDLGTFGGRISALVRGQLAAEESIIKSQRTKRGRARAAALGRNPGRPPFGYAFDGTTWTAPGAAAVLRCYEGASQPLWQVARDLNGDSVPSYTGAPWSAAMVREVIQCRRGNGDPYVTGLWIGQRGAPAIPVPAIVPAELAARARAQVAGRAHAPPRGARHVYLLDDRACRCELCGGWIGIVSCRGRLRADGTRARFAYYCCANRYGGKARGVACTLPVRRVEQVDEAVWRAVLAWADGVVGRVEVEREEAGDLEEAERRLAGEEARLGALADALGSGAISAESYRTQVGRVVARRDLLAQQVATWRAARPAAAPSAAERAEMRLAVRTAGADPAARRALVRRLWPEWVADETGVGPVRSEAVAQSAGRQLRRVVAGG